MPNQQLIIIATEHARTFDLYDLLRKFPLASIHCRMKTKQVAYEIIGCTQSH